MKAYTGYADWIRNSNSAAKFREAFELVDKIDSTIRIAMVEKLYRIANAEWEEVKEMASEELSAVS